MSKRAAFFALGLVATLVGMTGPAAAQASSAPTSVSASYNESTGSFEGTVSSPSSECVPGRTVTLFEMQVDGSSDQVGSTVSGPDGSFSIPLPGADGQFFVTVSARSEGGYGEVDSCEGARSGTILAGSGILGGADDDDDDDGVGIGDDGDGAGLPFTGSELASYTLLALGLVGAGALIMRRTRHRHHRRPIV